MVSLKEAIKLSKLEDDKICYLRKKKASKYDALVISVADIRKKYDMKKTQIVSIQPKFYFDGEYMGIEFEIE